ncbi:MAG: DUF4962 domain-containing protein, partial [Planctomycetes bacterium]|nr:DUF4962 domain-containing protein [Planctomycetota bacterium]
MDGFRAAFAPWLWCLIATSGLFNAATTSAEQEDPLASLRTEHPRLLFTRTDQQRIEQLARHNKLLARLIRQNTVNAERMLNQPPVRYEIPDGKRLLGQSRKCIQRVAAMAMAYRLTGERRFAEGALKDMQIAAGFKDWNPRHFLDTAEMTTALALGYDWLFDVLTAEQRELIRRAIIDLGLNPGLKVYAGGRWWTRGENNWNQVCNGGMILGALAIAEDEPELARRVIRAALKSVPAGLSVYKPSGAYPEGPGYWQYGTSYTALTISALLTALGRDFQISKTPGLDKTGLFRIHTIGPTGLYFNYADCGMNSRPAAAMFLLSQVFDQPLYAWWHRQRLAELVPEGTTMRARSLDRFFPLEIAWYDPRGQRPTSAELPLDALFRSRQDVVTMRSAWGNPNAVYIGFKGGDNRTNHGHLDVGSFILDAEGVRWALDLGSDDYNMPGYFGRQRWTYYRLINHSHNTPVINDQIQNPAARCPVSAFRSTPQRASAIVDMTDAYKGQARSVWRGIELVERRVVQIRDEIEGATGNVRWGMVTPAEIKLDGRKATLTLRGKTLTAYILEPADARFEVVSTKPPTAREKSNAGTRMLAITVAAGPSRRMVIRVALTPGNRLL